MRNREGDRLTLNYAQQVARKGRVLVEQELGAPERIATRGWQRDHLFYTGMSLASLVSVFIGFAPTYYLKNYFGAPSLQPLVHLHGFVFTSWILLFFTQTILIAGHRTRLHRRLGAAGGWLAALLVVVGLTTAIVSGRRNFIANSVGSATFLAIPFGDMLVFLVLAVAGLYHRRRPETHKRLMLLATIGLLDAAIARWPLTIIRASPVAFFEVTDLFVLAGVIYDLVSRQRIHPAYLWGGLLILGSQPLRLAISHTNAWLRFAGLLLR